MTLFTVLYGALLGLALLKFGNPVILDRLIEAPKDVLEFIYSPWPLIWGQAVLLGLAVLGFSAGRLTLPKPIWPAGALAVWLVWQVLALGQTVDLQRSHATLLHFGTCVVCFGLGLFSLGRCSALRAFCAGLLPFFVWMLWVGFEQYYGGLDATERMIRETPNWQQVYPPEYLERIAKKRIFATLVYPNALAGVVLLLLPILLVEVWRISSRLAAVSRAVLVGVLAYAGVACLVWSGSKSGWLIAVGVVAIALLHRPFSRRAKVAVAVLVCAVGMAAFAVKFASYFQKGAASVGARFDYWSAAWQTAMEHPILGTGPGTFGRVYAKIRPAGAEMAQLVHNDYLEQASDSGLVGLLTYGCFWLASMICLRRGAWADGSGARFACWLGLLAWSAQGMSEFGLYIPAVSWPAFTLVGWLWARNDMDRSEAIR